MTAKRLPNDPDAEKAVVGMLLVGTTAQQYLFGALTQGDFFTPSLGAAFEACRQLYEMGRKADPVTVRDLLHSNGYTTVEASTLISALANAPASSHAPEYAELVGRHAVARRAMLLASEATQALGAGHHPQAVIDGLVDGLGHSTVPS